MMVGTYTCNTANTALGVMVVIYYLFSYTYNPDNNILGYSKKFSLPGEILVVVSVF